MLRNFQRSHRRRSTSIRVALLASVVAASGGCSADSPTGPRLRPLDPGRPPAFDVVTVTLGTPSTNAPPAYGEPQPVNSGARILPWKAFRVRASGSLQVLANAACPLLGVDTVTVHPPGMGPFYNAAYALRVIPVDSSYTPTSTGGGGTGWTQDPVGGGWVSYFYNAYDDRSVYVWAARVGRNSECYNVQTETWLPSDALSGSQTLAVEPLVFDVTAATEEFFAGDTVHFTLASELPTANVQWVFNYTAGGSLSLPACSGQTACNAAPTGSGRMEASVLESLTNTYVRTRSVQVTQAPSPCLEPQDWIAGNAAVQRGLRALLDSAQAWGPRENRRERFGGIWENISTGELKLVPIAPMNPTVCSVEITSPLIISPGAGWRIVAAAHVHPYRGETATDSSEVVPTTCPTAAAGQPVGRGEYIPSPDDWTTMMAAPLWGRALPGYIISSRNIVKFDAASINAGDENARPGLTQRWPWNTPTCRMRNMAAPPVPPT